MKIFLISRNDRYDYDEYDSAVVVGEDEDDVLKILKNSHGEEKWNGWGKYDVTISEVLPSTPRIVIESYNAG